MAYGYGYGDEPKPKFHPQDPKFAVPARPDKKGHRQNFLSLNQLVDCAGKAPATVPENQRYSHRLSKKDGWQGSESFEAMEHLAKHGWAEGRAMVMKLQKILFSKLSKMVFKPKVVFGEEGDGFDVSRALQGEPESFIRFVDSNKVGRGSGKRIVKVVSSVDAACFVGMGPISRRGAAICSVIAALEQAGRRCEVWATVGSYGSGGKQLQNAVCVKKAEHPLNMEVLAFALGHPAVLRRLFFGAWETLPANIRGIYHMGDSQYMGYGGITEADIEGDIVLKQASFYDSCWKSEEATYEWCLQELKKQGVLLAA